MADQERRSGKARNDASKSGGIDTHHHYFPPQYLVPLERWAKETGVYGYWPIQRDWTAAAAIADMDRNGIATSILSISTPGVYFGDVEAARRMARICNDYAAEMMRDHPGRFGLFASVPMPDVEGTLREMEYAFDVLKADGVGFSTSYEDKWPGDPLFRPVFEELNRRRSVAYFHPLAPNCCRGLLPGVSGSPIEYPFDTTRAVMSLLTGGTLARCKAMSFLFSHAGGTVPMLAGRIANALKNRKDVAEIAPAGIDGELKSLYYDTANSFYAPTMAALQAFVPQSQIVFGTDFPYLSIGQNLEGLAKIGFTEDQLASITRNAAAFLPRLKA